METTNLTKIALAVVVLGMCGSAWAFSGAGSGTAGDPYIITNVNQLQEMQNDLDACYALGNDIDASDTVNWNGGAGFDPVGITADPNDGFTGKLDGRDHVITGLFINRPSENNVGLFGIAEGAEIKNVGVINVNVTAKGNAGTLVGYSITPTTIANCWCSGSVVGTDSIQTALGGLVGVNGWGAYMSKCYSSATVNGASNRVGGLVGVNFRGSIIEDSYSTGDVSGTSKIGGLVGDNARGSDGGYVARCYSTGHVTGSGGGLIGYNYEGGITYDSYWDTQTSGKTTSYGGTPKPTSEMKKQATFVGWDFVNTWDIQENVTYPFLRGAGVGTGPVAHWKFDEGTGSIAYDSAGGNDGIIYGAQWTTGIINGALDFDGVDDYVAVTDNPTLSPEQITISAWIYPEDVSHNFQIVGKWGMYNPPCDYVFDNKNNNDGLRFASSMNLSGYDMVEIYSEDAVLNTNMWQHVAVTWDGSTCTFYVNSENVGEDSNYSGNLPDSDNPVYIGRNYDWGTGGPRPLDGKMDDVRIYDRALSAAEIMELYGPYSGPVAHWKFDEGSGTIAYDSAGTNDGTIYGAVWATGVIDGALDFDGVDDYVNLGNDSSLKPSFPVSLSVWIKMSNLEPDMEIITLDTQDGYNNYYGIWLLLRNQGNDMYIGYGDGGIAGVNSRRSKGATLSLNENVWYYATAIIKGPTDMNLYINGVDVGGWYQGNGGGLVYSNGNSSIGARQNDRAGSENHFNGKIDDVRIYDRALSAAEIQQIYGPYSGPVAHWKFDEGTGSIAYDSAGNNDGTIYGAAWATGVIDGALDFDGVNDYVGVPDSLSMRNLDGSSAEYSISLWFNTTQPGASIWEQPTIFERRSPSRDEWTVSICLNADDAIGVIIMTPGIDSRLLDTLPVNDGSWHHVTATRKNTEYVKIFVDGNLRQEGSTITDPSTTDLTTIGVRRTNLNIYRNYFDGTIDDVRIYDRALSAAEIQELYNSVPVPPVGDTYHVDGVNGSDLNDGLTKGTAFATIQKGINSSDDGCTVLVWPGVYNEAATQGINFKGKAITVKSAADAAVLEVPGFNAVTFAQGEDGNSVFSNFVVRGSDTGILALFANPTISNVTIVDNDNGIIADNADPEINNCMFWNNFNGDLFGSPDPIEAGYSWFEDDVNEPNMPAAGLVSHWKFNEGGGLIAYDSAGNNDGVVFGAAWTTSPFGNALDFDGVDDYVEVAHNEDFKFSGGFTLSAWAKPILVDDRGRLITCEDYPVTDGYYLTESLDGNGEWHFCVFVGGTYALIRSDFPPKGEWQNIVAVRENNGVLKMYVDGVVQTETLLKSGAIDNLSANLKLGTNEIASTAFFNGKIDEVAIYNRALSAEEIEQIYEPVPNPLFADADGGDYHLKSERGRYWPAHDVWVLDDETSPCIDGGDPGIGPTNEPMPNGGRINMGAYGNTAYASMSECRGKADINCDGIVNFKDLAIFAQFWLEE